MSTNEHERIARFKTMTEADPENELGHFSLGKAYLEAGQLEPAVASLTRALELNAGFSKAYALLGQAQRQLGQSAAAIATLTKGYQVAHEHGDLMPRNEMAKHLEELGAPVPAATGATLTAEMAAAGNIQCRRCGRVAPQMPEPPFRDALGEQIRGSVCKPCFQEWVSQGTKVINELRLNLTEKQGQDVFDQYMKEFLNLQ